MESDEDDDLPPRVRPDERGTHDKPPPESEDESGNAAFPDFGNAPLLEWLTRPTVERAVKLRFARFLHRFTTPGAVHVYRHKLLDLCLSDAKHLDLEVSYLHLSDAQPRLAICLADAPAQMLRMFDEVARDELRNLGYGHDRDVFVRITGLPLQDEIHELLPTYYEVLVTTSGVVTHRSGIFRQLLYVAFDCNSCGAAEERRMQDVPRSGTGMPASCPQCRSEGPFSASEARSRVLCYRKVTLLERSDSVAAGRMPRCLDVVLMNSLIDAVRLGDDVEVTGIYTQRFDSSLNAAAGLPDYQVALVANYVRRL